MKNHVLTLITAAFFLVLFSCSPATTDNASSSTNENSALHTKRNESSVEKVAQTTNSPTTQLIDLIRRLPGVNVSGSLPNYFVTTRGVTSTDGPTGVLYVVDNVQMGNEYSSVAEVVDVTRIQNVSVLKGSETAIYGSQGEGGVIVIKMKPLRE